MINKAYTREQRINDLSDFLNAIPMNESTRVALIKQIAMVRVNDMNMAHETKDILDLQLEVMDGAAMGKVS
jgi:hypothetical protein